MIRFFCTTNTCTIQRAQLCHAAQTEAVLRGQLAHVTAERDGLALQLAAVRRELAAAKDSADFYMDLFCTAREAQP